MTKGYPYTADVVASVLLTILAVALIVVSESVPGGLKDPLIGIPRDTASSLH